MKFLLKLFLALAGIILVLALWNILQAKSQTERIKAVGTRLDGIEASLEKTSSTLAAIELETEQRRVTVTMYTSRPQETDSTPCVGAANVDICKLLRVGVEVCASNDYAFGTRLTVKGLGTCTVLDRMARRYTGQHRLDWYAGKDLNRAITFGVKDLLIVKN